MSLSTMVIHTFPEVRPSEKTANLLTISTFFVKFALPFPNKLCYTHLAE